MIICPDDIENVFSSFPLNIWYDILLFAPESKSEAFRTKTNDPIFALSDIDTLNAGLLKTGAKSFSSCKMMRVRIEKKEKKLD